MFGEAAQLSAKQNKEIPPAGRNDSNRVLKRGISLCAAAQQLNTLRQTINIAFATIRLG